MNVLAIDTATETLSVALLQSGKVTETMALTTKNDHATHLMPTIVKVMEKARLQPENIDEIVVGNGPGSYTGTRIGITTAKTIAWSLEVATYSVSSLEAIAFFAKDDANLICPFIDARRNAVYTGLYEISEGKLLNKIEDTHVSVDKWLSQLDKMEETICFISPHLENYQSMFSEILKDKAVFFPIKEQNIIAENLLKIYQKYDDVNVHSVIPNYIRKTEAEIKLEQQLKGELNRD